MVNRRGERLRDLFSATITLSQHWLVCLKGFVMPADQIQFMHGKVANFSLTAPCYETVCLLDS